MAVEMKNQDKNQQDDQNKQNREGRRPNGKFRIVLLVVEIAVLAIVIGLLYVETRIERINKADLSTNNLAADSAASSVTEEVKAEESSYEEIEATTSLAQNNETITKNVANKSVNVENERKDKKSIQNKMIIFTVLGLILSATFIFGGPCSIYALYLLNKNKDIPSKNGIRILLYILNILVVFMFAFIVLVLFFSALG